MKKRYRIPGTDVYILLEQDDEFNVKILFERLASSYLWPAIEDDREMITALGFPLGVPPVIDAGELEPVPDPT